ncbi:hypothetical protein EYF80_059334 [Liparis tanakae]|uniref:Uncharacterized protein n=1 Tax=Liparis tanakae TaxID=230148 RepID=A0A4Z2EQ76_9TELE|nr:hypothetical protein EYF80_059334 [Liparis tanakae]
MWRSSGSRLTRNHTQTSRSRSRRPAAAAAARSRSNQALARLFAETTATLVSRVDLKINPPVTFRVHLTPFNV